MTGARGRCAALLALLAAAYIALFVPANGTGSADANMLGVFQIDEFAQYHALWRMTDPAESAGAGLRQFVAYDYYSYGFPFFAASALAFWPFRWAYTSANAPGLTHASMLMLRELSPLLHVASILILVGLWTGFRSTPRAAALFVFLAALPAVVSDSLWWHPDAAVTLFVVATIAALARDRRRLGRWFYAAAVACGLATATKLIPLVLRPVAVQLARALPGRSPREVILHGAGSPRPGNHDAREQPDAVRAGRVGEDRHDQGPMQSIIAFGWGERGSAGFSAWEPTLRSGYGGAIALLAFTALCIAAIARDRAHRDLAVVILAFALPLGAYVIFEIAYQSERYLLPALLPLASCAGSEVGWRALRDRTAPSAARAASALVALALLSAFADFLTRDAQRYREVLEREQNSASLAFYRELERGVIAALPPGASLRILRTPYVYVPPDPRFEVHLRWGGLELGDLAAANPDLVLVRREDLDRYGDPTFFTRANEAERAHRMYAFYSAAARDALPGYQRLLETDFALAFGRVRN
jgi:4-amino-4-deoxy-L-arabinose transferase-like glycosyltransferase